MKFSENLDEVARKLGYPNKWWFFKDMILVILFLSVVANYWINEKAYCQELVKWYNKICPILLKDWNPDLPFNLSENYSSGNWSIDIGD